MSTSLANHTSHAGSVQFTASELVVGLTDGRTICVPLVWFPRLLAASEPQRAHWELLGNGEGIHWPELDEDLSVEGLLRGVPAPPSEKNAR
ncbi:MAG: DUF2442 domain-containing protein [Thermoanaerobaculia bacterium]